jgi:carbamoyltransferase
MKILGLAAPFSHDAAAALLIDGKVVAAVEEERFTRQKHEGRAPVNSIRFCLKQAGLKPSDIDHVAFPWSIDILKEKRFEYFFRTMWTKPSKGFKKLTRNEWEFNHRKDFVYSTLRECGFDMDKTKVHWVEHQLAHAASAYCFSGMKDAALLSIDAGGEITSTLLGVVEKNGFKKLKEITSEDSLGNFYATMTDYLGFERGEGEYKVMGMAPYGDPSKMNFDHIIWWDEKRKTFHCNDDYVWVIRSNRHRLDKVYSKKMIKEFAPEREGDGLSEPYIHIAAITQKKLEDMTIKLVETYLKEHLQKCGNLCFAGGVALNVSLNRKLLQLPYIKNLWVQPASNDAGTSLGAAAYVAYTNGERFQPMTNVYLGPEFSDEEIKAELDHCGFAFTKENNIAEKTADLLNEGKIVGWFQGRMEWGPRALGARSILGNPTIKGTADKINAIIKFRENWRPFCPSMLKEKAADIIGSNHAAPFMTIAFTVTDAWKMRLPEVVHVDGTCRPQLVDKNESPKYYAMIESFYKKTGVPVVINTSLNRRGEAMVCSPKDAVLMFRESALDFLAIGNYLVRKAA